MKKIFSLTLVLLMLVMTVVPVSANQDAITAEAVFTIGSTTAAPGDVVTLPISLKNTVLANSFGVRNFVYDESVLEFVGFEEAENLSNVFTLRTFNNDLKAILVGASQANTFDMALGNVKFKVNDSAADGDYTVNATLIAKNGSTDLTSLVVPATITVAKPSMEGLAFENATYTYDGTAKSLAVTGLPEGASVKYTSEDLSADGEAINAGTYNITATVTKDGYNTWTKTATLTIEKKDATITVNNAAKTIGQADPEFTYTVTGEATEGDITGIELTRAEGDAVGTYEIDAKYTANNNYNVTVVKGTLTISNKKIQHVKVAGVVENKTYGDDGFKVTVTPDTESGIDTYTITSSNTDVATVENGTVTIKGAGETTITVNVEGSEVYEPFEQSWTLTVAKKDATITVNNAAKTIGQADPEFTYTVTGEATEGDITGIELTRAEGDAVGTYEIDAKYTANNNYNVTVVKGTLTISNKKIQKVTVAGVVENKTYGDDGFKVTVTPDTESGIDTYTITSSNTDVATVENGTVTIKGAGETTITVNVEGSEVYEPFEQSWTLTVAKKDATITVNNAAKTIGQTDPEFTYTVTGEATEGDITGIELTRAEGDAVGTYEIDAKYTANNNYNVTVVKGTLTINKKAQTLTVADITDKQYGDTFTLDVASDSTSSVTFNYSSDNTDVATVTGEGVVTIVSVGNANITVTALENDECESASVTKALVAAKRDIAVTAIDMKAETVTFENVVAEDDVDLDYEVLELKDTNSEEGTAKLTNFVLTGDDAEKYNLTNTEIAVAFSGVPEEEMPEGAIPENVDVSIKILAGTKTVLMPSIVVEDYTEPVLTLDITKVDSTVENIWLPKTAFTELEEKDTKLEIKLAIGSAAFDKKAMKAIADEAGADVSLKIAEPSDSQLNEAQVNAKAGLQDSRVFRFELNSGAITSFGEGEAIVTVPYIRENSGTVSAKYLTEEGETEEVESVSYNEEYAFAVLKLKHFSEYVVYTIPPRTSGKNPIGVTGNVSVNKGGKDEDKDNEPDKEEVEEPAPSEGKFTDVPAWAEKAVENLSKLGIVSGRGEGKFDPNGKVTRAEFAVMIARMFSLDAEEEESPFTDCGKDDWFTPHVNAAAKAGFISGVGEGKFNPSATISRQDICTILGRALNVDATKDVTFADSADIAEYAAKYVEAFAVLGVVSGYEDKTFAPKANATRAEAAAILNNVISLDLEVVKEAVEKLTAAVEE